MVSGLGAVEEFYQVELIRGSLGGAPIITTGLAKGLVELQDQIYKIALAAQHTDTSGKRVTEAIRREFELSFAVKPGCSELLADVSSILESLTTILKGMDSKMLATVILGSVGMIAISWAATAHWKHKNRQMELSNEDKENQRQHELKLEQLRNSQQEHAKSVDAIGEVVKALLPHSPVLQATKKVVDSAPATIARNCAGATSLDVGAVHFDETEIRELAGRAPKKNTSVVDLLGEYVVTEMGPRDSPLSAFMVKNVDGQVFRAYIDAEDGVGLTINQLDALYASYRDSKAIELPIWQKISATGEIQKTFLSLNWLATVSAIP